MFLDYQEAKTKNFAQQFCVPTFMLRKLPPIQLKAYKISEKFNTATHFAEKRLLHYENQLLSKICIIKCKNVITFKPNDTQGIEYERKFS